jgi:two-component system response regulator GlrR
VTDAAPCHLLVVDDDPSVLQLFAEIFTDAGYRVTTMPAAPSTAEVARLAPDLVVMDHRLHGESGWLAIRRLAADPTTAAIPAILCTADYGAVNRLLNEPSMTGVTPVRKPFDLDDLLTAVATALTSCPEGDDDARHGA